MPENQLIILPIFFLTILFILWRPRGISETIPTSIAAIIIFIAGIVPISDIYKIFNIVSGASITIISTIVMSIVLESIGLFKWAAFNIIEKAKGSGKRLFWYLILLCFLMTLFFNNDGSILITTPIIIHIVRLLNLKNHQKIPYLLSGALIATSSSAPIGVSNLANLIALDIVGLDLNTYTYMMFIPSMIGIGVMAFLLYYYFKKDIPLTVPVSHSHSKKHNIHNSQYPFTNHPLNNIQSNKTIENVNWNLFRISLAIVVLTRASLFMFNAGGVPIEIPAVIGALLLILVRWFHTNKGVKDIINKTPWHILLFAFGMYVIVYGLQNTGLTSFIVEYLGESISTNHFNAIFITGFLLTIMSITLNNLPSVMIGTITLLDMNLEPATLKISYLAAIIGADIGSLITPMGTLASLIWMHILKKNGIEYTWGQYIKTSVMIVPIVLIISLLSLYIWNSIFLS